MGASTLDNQIFGGLRKPVASNDGRVGCARMAKRMVCTTGLNTGLEIGATIAAATERQGITIGQLIIAHKIERVKELIVYGELNLTEISYVLNYSSVAHLSNQFKKVTGLTPSHFKKLKQKRKGGLDEV